ncbi:antirestriction protein ArdA [Clostridium perfringens]|nr:antirestriction protein ArdA [Clostridium perfringens]
MKGIQITFYDLILDSRKYTFKSELKENNFEFKNGVKTETINPNYGKPVIKKENYNISYVCNEFLNTIINPNKEIKEKIINAINKGQKSITINYKKVPSFKKQIESMIESSIEFHNNNIKYIKTSNDLRLLKNLLDNIESNVYNRPDIYTSEIIDLLDDRIEGLLLKEKEEKKELLVDTMKKYEKFKITLLDKSNKYYIATENDIILEENGFKMISGIRVNTEKNKKYPVQDYSTNYGFGYERIESVEGISQYIKEEYKQCHKDNLNMIKNSNDLKKLSVLYDEIKFGMFEKFTTIYTTEIKEALENKIIRLQNKPNKDKIENLIKENKKIIIETYLKSSYILNPKDIEVGKDEIKFKKGISVKEEKEIEIKELHGLSYIDMKNIKEFEKVQNDNKKGAESMEALAKVYVTNLGKYNEGYLVGKWFDLPCVDFETEFNEVLKSIRIDGVRYEEYFITDWETEINGLEIGEYTNIEELNKKLLEVQSNFNNDKYYIEKLSTIIDCFGYDIENAMENMENHTFLQLEMDSFKDEINLANAYLLEVAPISELPRQVLENNFNYESYGRDIQLNNYNNFFEDEKEIEEMDKMTEKEVADWFLELIGSIDDLAREELERYFDIESYGRELMQSYSIDRETYIAVSDY